MSDPLPRAADDARMPRWVKLALIGGVIAIALLGAMLLWGHGPARHLPAAPDAAEASHT